MMKPDPPDSAMADPGWPGRPNDIRAVLMRSAAAPGYPAPAGVFPPIDHAPARSVTPEHLPAPDTV